MRSSGVFLQDAATPGRVPHSLRLRIRESRLMAKTWDCAFRRRPHLLYNLVTQLELQRVQEASKLDAISLEAAAEPPERSPNQDAALQTLFRAKMTSPESLEPRADPLQRHGSSPMDGHISPDGHAEGLSHRRSLRRQSTLRPETVIGPEGSIPLTRIQTTHHTRSSVDEDPELPSEPPPPPGPAPQANAPPPVEEVTYSRLAAHYAGLVLASMVGCLVRLGLTALGTYDGASVYPLLWSQGVGCGIMGLTLARKSELAEIYPPIYTFITTGIAGSVTTFSSWMLESFLAFSNADHYDRKGLHDTVDGVAYSFSTWLVALAAIDVGFHFSSLLPALPSRYASPPKVDLSPREKTQARQDDGSASSSATAGVADPETVPQADPTAPRHHRHLNPLTGATPVLDTIFIASAFATYLVALLVYFLGPHGWRHKATFPMLFSPPGAILRFSLGRINVRSPFIDRFPLGTFIANMVATLVVCGTYVGMRFTGAGGLLVGGMTRCNALWGIEQGFCGCLSTVSTFVVEARAIKSKKWKWIYVGGSVVLGHLFALAVVGGTRWSRGLGEVCS